jgi:ubiquinone biosynthesis O-methyltransferase
VNNNKKDERDEDIREFFNDMSKGRNETINANPIINYEQSLRARVVLGSLDIKDGERVLDIGCGNARDILYIARTGAQQVVGVDISDGMVLVAKEELEANKFENILLQVGDVTALDFPDCHFDKVLCSEVIEHVPDVNKAFVEMRRVLKPGGRLVISTPNKVSWYGFERYWIWEKLLRRHWPHPCDEWRTLSEVVSIINTSGLRILDTKTVCFIPGFMITYFVLPKVLQKLMVRFVEFTTPLFKRIAPNRGYTLCVVAVRDA